jgi:hypothetical protein
MSQCATPRLPRSPAAAGVIARVFPWSHHRRQPMKLQPASVAAAATVASLVSDARKPRRSVKSRQCAALCDGFEEVFVCLVLNGGVPLARDGLETVDDLLRSALLLGAPRVTRVDALCKQFARGRAFREWSSAPCRDRCPSTAAPLGHRGGPSIATNVRHWACLPSTGLARRTGAVLSQRVWSIESACR